MGRGRMVVGVGETSRRVYQLDDGRLQVVLLSPSGRQVILRDLAGGEVFGELAAIDDRPRSAAIFALDDCDLTSLAPVDFRQAVYGDAAAAEWLARRLAAQLRDLTERIFHLNVLPAASRLHCEILRLAGEAARQTDGAPTLHPAPTHAEWAARIGSQRESVSRQMSWLGERGIIAASGRRLTVTDLGGLADLVRQAVGAGAA